MVLIRSLKFAGLFSYANETELEFSNRLVLVGPNNSGKSNIIRILRLLVDSFYRFRKLQGQDISHRGDDPFLEIRLTLSRNETQKLVEYLSCYSEQNNQIWRYHECANKEVLLKKLDEISIKLTWKRELHQYGSDPYMELNFEKIGLWLCGTTTYSQFSVSNKKPAIPNRFKNRDDDLKLYEILEKVTDEENFKEIISGIFQEREEEFLPLWSLRYTQNSNSDYNEKLVFANLLSYVGVDINFQQEISLVKFLGAIFKHGFNYAERLSTYDLSDFIQHLRMVSDQDNYDRTLLARITSFNMKLTDELNSDGSNLAQFLFYLRMSSDSYEKREKFENIRHAFNDIMGSTELNVDVALEYQDVKPNVVFGGKDELQPKRPMILITDKKLKKQFPLEQVGAGIAEILYILTACYGIENSVIILDEPAINLHPTMMKTLLKYIENPDNKNQFLIITHSAELLQYELFESNAEIFYVRKSDQTSTIKSLKGNVKDQFKKERDRLRHQIDSRIFFGKGIILTEGESDKNLLTGVSQYVGSSEKDFDLSLNDVYVTSVNGKDNFSKYKMILDSLEIPHIILADSDAQSIFPSHGSISDKEIINRNNVFIVENGDLEKLMQSMDSVTYSKLEHEIGNSKPTIAYEFAKEISKNNPDVLKPIKSLIEVAINKSQK